MISLDETVQPIVRPVFILAAPRSGSSLLFELLSNCRELWTVGGESHKIIEGIPSLHIFECGTESNRLTVENATPEVCGLLPLRFVSLLRDRDGHFYEDVQPGQVRMLEKTPKNSLRVEFLNEVFPDAQFIYLYRDARENISSIMEAWREEDRFLTYTQLDGWGGDWKLLLPPGWRRLRDKPLEQVAAFQWAAPNMHIMDDLENIPDQRWIDINYADLVSNPRREIRRICKFVGHGFDRRLAQAVSRKLPLSRSTLTPPRSGKWKKNAREIKSVLPPVQHVTERIEEVVEARAEVEVALPDQPAIVTGESVAQAVGKPRRNAPCPCGSGRKFKHCHGAEGGVPSA